MTFFQAFCLGAVQGITEFFPVSSSAHVAIVSKLLGCLFQDKVFSIFLNLGSLLAIMLFFRRQVGSMFLGAVDFIRGRGTEDRYFFMTIFLSSLPTVVIFGTLELVFGAEINSPMILSGALILFSVILYWCDRNPTEKKSRASRKDSLLVGLVQPLSFVPGVSRLGICMSMMRYLKYSREESFQYSMVLSIPPVLGACSLKLMKVILGQSVVENWPFVAVGCVSAFAFGLISLHFMIKFLRNYTLLPIIIYRIFLGLLI